MSSINVTNGVTAPRAAERAVTPWSFEDVVERGRIVFDTETDGKWLVGDYVNQYIAEHEPSDESENDHVKRVEATFKAFAEAWKVRKSDVKSRSVVARCFPQKMRAEYHTLSWSHFRAASRASLDTPAEKVIDLLAKADSEDWPVGKLRRAITGKTDTPDEVRTFEVDVIRDEATGMLYLDFHSEDWKDFETMWVKPYSSARLVVTVEAAPTPAEERGA